MSKYSIIRDEISTDEKKSKISGEAYFKDDKVTVSETLTTDNSRYSYVETYKNENGIIIIGASSKLGLDQRENIIPKYTKMGIWFYDSGFINNIEGISEIIDNIHSIDNPIETLDQFNSDLYYNKHILPDLFTSALICLKNDYSNRGDNTSYLVEKQLSDGTRMNLSFKYVASSDFREQLSNLYHSIIDVNGFSETYLKECGIYNEIQPSKTEIAMFNGKEFMNNIKKEIKVIEEKKGISKKLVK